MSHDDMITVIQAHKEGKPIQAKAKHEAGARWQPFTSSLECGWDTWTWDYRVKPEPRKFWICYDKELESGWFVNEAVHPVPQALVGDRKMICVREVLDEEHEQSHLS